MKRLATSILCGVCALATFGRPALAASETESSSKASASASATSSAAVNAPAADSASTSSGVKGRLGVGGLRALSGYRALVVKYYLNPKWSISGALGLDFFSPESGSSNRNVVNVLFAPGLHYWITPANQSGPITASFGLGGRLGIYLGGGPLESSRSGVNVELGSTAEVFLGKHFSLAPEAGLVFRFVNNGPDPAGTPDGFGISLGRNTGLFGGGSFNFYF